MCLRIMYTRKQDACAGAVDLEQISDDQSPISVYSLVSLDSFLKRYYHNIFKKELRYTYLLSLSGAGEDRE